MFKLTSLIKEMKHISKVNYELTWAGPQKFFYDFWKNPISTHINTGVHFC